MSERGDTTEPDSDGKHTRYSMRAVEALFQGALERPSGKARRAWLERATGSDSDLLREVEELLASHETAADFLEQPVLLADIAQDASALDVAPAGAEIGDELGPYKLVEVLGEGGFGTVYRAEQEVPVRREVALKVIKLGMDTRQVIARFESERQALAVLDHPAIARVLDAGATSTGRPYFVMDLAPGEDLNTFCDSRSLTIEQRLQVFLEVCSAIQHAHQRGIIHRDLKPSNVLVAEVDGRIAPKVIDFGIAKATTADLSGGATLFTQAGQVIGTPVFMSPEQASGGADIDTRTDVYSLGVILYQLLCGSTPLSSEDLLSRGSGTDIASFLRDAELTLPSMRAQQGGATTQRELADKRSATPNELKSALKGDLDNIALCALEPERDRRYESVAALARDIERSLENRPIEASAASSVYRARKFLRRHRVATLAVASVLVAVIAGASISIKSLRAKRDQADILQGVFSAATGEGGEMSTPAQVRRRVALAFGSDAPIVVDALATLADRLARTGAMDESLDARRLALQSAQEIHGEDARETMLAHAALGLQLSRMGSHDAAQVELVRAVELDGGTTDGIGAGTPESIPARLELARLLSDDGALAEALAHVNDANQIAREATDDHQLRADALELLADTQRRLGKIDDAHESWEDLINTTKQLASPTSLAVPRERIELGRWLASVGRPDDAAVQLGDALASLRATPGAPPSLKFTAITAFNSAVIDASRKLNDELARGELAREVELADELYAPGSGTHSETLRRVALHHEARGEPGESLKLLIRRYEEVAALPFEATSATARAAHQSALQLMREDLVTRADAIRYEADLDRESYFAARRAIEIALEFDPKDEMLLTAQLALTYRMNDFMAIFGQLEKLRGEGAAKEQDPRLLVMEAVALSQVSPARKQALDRLEKAKELAKDPRFRSLRGLAQELELAETLIRGNEPEAR